MNAENASLWDRSIWPRNIEGIEAFRLFFKLSGNSNTCTPGSMFCPAKRKLLLSLPARGRCRTIISRPGQVLEREDRLVRYSKKKHEPLPMPASPSKTGNVSALFLADSCMFSKCLIFSRHSKMLGKWMKERKGKERNHYLIRGSKNPPQASHINVKLESIIQAWTTMWALALGSRVVFYPVFLPWVFSSLYLFFGFCHYNLVIWSVNPVNRCACTGEHAHTYLQVWAPLSPSTASLSSHSEPPYPMWTLIAPHASTIKSQGQSTY